jgi:hypothetical protein
MEKNNRIGRDALLLAIVVTGAIVLFGWASGSGAESVKPSPKPIPGEEEVLRVHTNIQLHHGGVRVWCLDCHSAKEREYLVPLSDGKLISFEHSYELCGKCHGTKYRDWRNGIHGKRIGYWNGPKTYLLCTQCHNPHRPLFRPIKPMPPPKKPRAPKEADARH